MIKTFTTTLETGTDANYQNQDNDDDDDSNDQGIKL